MNFLFKLIPCFLISALSLHAGVYENLEYGDTRLQVTEKLAQCERVKSTIPTTMFGRAGLNGNFKVLKPLNGIHFTLYFGWDSEQKLNEITLRSEAISEEQYNSVLSDTFSAASRLITELHGPSVMSNAMPKANKLEDGVILNSHLWHPSEGSLLMGVAKDKGKYHLSIRFVKKRIEPVKK